MVDAVGDLHALLTTRDRASEHELASLGALPANDLYASPDPTSSEPASALTPQPPNSPPHQIPDNLDYLEANRHTHTPNPCLPTRGPARDMITVDPYDDPPTQQTST